MENTTEEIVEEQLSEIEQKRLENIEAAHATNNLIITHKNYDKNKKFKNYDVDLRNRANQLYREIKKNKNNIKYEQYKRGRIVFVEFGTNIGNELSGSHFAIVINNDDNENNSLLTVIPLSSKNNKMYLNLGDELWIDIIVNIFDKFDFPFPNEDVNAFINILFRLSKIMKNQDIDKNKKELFSSIYEVIQINHDLNALDDDTDNSININEKYYLNIMNYFLDLTEKEQESIEDFCSLCDSFHEYLNKNFTQEDIDKIMSNESDDLNIRLNKLFIELVWDANKLEIYKAIFNEFYELEKKLLKYKDLNKNTYAIINQIVTVSKTKIRKFSSNHPLKFAYISDKSLDLIDSRIKDRLLKKETIKNNQ